MDNIANFLTTIRNAQAVKHETVKVPYSKVSFGIAEILQKEEWIEKVEVKERGKKPFMILILKYDKEGSPLISGLTRISKPGKRVYVGYEDVKKVRQGYGISILSTSKGIITNKQARSEKLGGELLCEVY